MQFLKYIALLSLFASFAFADVRTECNCGGPTVGPDFYAPQNVVASAYRQAMDRKLGLGQCVLGQDVLFKANVCREEFNLPMDYYESFLLHAKKTCDACFIKHWNDYLGPAWCDCRQNGFLIHYWTRKYND
ncbi:MAG: hypothetical protein BYD32DRAFT_410396 [Podila humilis]|nr:MAG: hypothetical protein BYD32DRAFT_410396 [Podila humilis]